MQHEKNLTDHEDPSAIRRGERRRVHEGEDFRRAFRRLAWLWVGVPFAGFVGFVIFFTQLEPRLGTAGAWAIGFGALALLQFWKDWWLWRCPACHARLLFSDANDLIMMKRPMMHECGAILR